MKKFILGLTLFLTLSVPTWLTSCEGGSTAMNATHVIGADMEAMLMSLGSILYEDPCLLTGGNAANTNIYVGASGAFASQRAAVISGRTDMAYTHTSADLPSTYLVSGNPFEEYGIIHNRGVNLIITSGGSDSTINKFGRHDSTFFDAVFSISPENFTTLERREMYDTVLARQIGSCLRTQLESEYAETMITDIKWDTLATIMSTTTRNNIRAVWVTYEEMVDEDSSMSDIFEFLNDQIDAVLRRNEVPTIEDQFELLAYTTIKHSHYYWTTK